MKMKMNPSPSRNSSQLSNGAFNNDRFGRNRLQDIRRNLMSSASLQIQPSINILDIEPSEDQLS